MLAVAGPETPAGFCHSLGEGESSSNALDQISRKKYVLKFISPEEIFLICLFNETVAMVFLFGRICFLAV